jgi:hypothetical protein
MIAYNPILNVNCVDPKLYTRVNNLRSSGGYVDLPPCEIPDQCGRGAPARPGLGREIAFAGRSNSGKSTAINAITQRSGLARVSRTPGARS